MIGNYILGGLVVARKSYLKNTKVNMLNGADKYQPIHIVM